MIKTILSAGLVAACLTFAALADPKDPANPKDQEGAKLADPAGKADPSGPKESAGAKARPYLGIMGENPVATEEGKSPAAQGAVIREVAPDSPAAKAGLMVGDRIISLNGQAIKSFEDLKVRIGVLSPKEEITLHLVRGDKDMDVAVELGEAKVLPRGRANQTLRQFLEENAPPGVEEQFDGIFEGRLPGQGGADQMQPRPMVGIEVQTIDDSLRSHLKLGDVKGVVIADVVAGSPAAKEGLQSEDVITQADGKVVTEPTQLQEIIQAKKAGDKVTLVIVRAGESQEKVVQVEEHRAASSPFSFRMPNTAGIDERLQKLQERLGVLEKNIEDRLAEKADAVKEKLQDAEQQAAKTATERIEQLEKRIAAMEANAEKLASKAVQQLEAKVAEMAKRIEEIAIPKEPVK
ncbi:PDZ domain-containing protein [bacterium]|nr:PDZ domain-containing protein [bacterium]